MAEVPPQEDDQLLSPDTPTSVSETSDPLLGRSIGNYTVLSVLGRGGFGDVYEAQDSKLNRRVALKFIQQSTNDFHSHMFEREAKALASLSKHPNIVQIYSWEEFEGKNFFILEYVGSSASDLIRKFPHGLPPELACRIVAECADALEHAHKAGILHRDIKSANILIEPDTGVAKLADFGLARIRTTATHHTIEGSAIGSPHYMAPEQVRGEELTHLCDVYSLGVTLYHLLCAQTPFIGKTPLEIMERVRNNQGTPIRDQVPDLPKSLVTIVSKATAHDPADRYQSAAELAQALRDFLSGKQIAAAPANRKTVRYAVAAGIAAVIIAAAVSLSIGNAGEADQTAPAAITPSALPAAFDEPLEPVNETEQIAEDSTTEPAEESGPDIEGTEETVAPSSAPGETKAQKTKRKFRKAFTRNN